jgi:ABC-2 type transport system ATP-binding protein
MWNVVRELRDSGVTIILTTHYIEEAEMMADRIGVIRAGEIILVDEKMELMRKLGEKQLTIHLQEKLKTVPDALAKHDLALAKDGAALVFTYDTKADRTGITSLLADLSKQKIGFNDIETSERSLEDIFVTLVHQGEDT